MQTAGRNRSTAMPNISLAVMFGICKHHAMQVRTLRQELGMSQEEFASRLGLKSKGHLSQIERGETAASIRVALELEKLSGGRIKAADINEEVALVSEHIAASSPPGA